MSTHQSGTERDAIRELQSTGLRTAEARVLCDRARATGHAILREGRYGRTQLVTWDHEAGYQVSREAEHSHDWTIAWRKRTANRFVRVSDWSGTWREASDLAGEIYKARKDDQPPLEVWYVPTREAELRTPLHEDTGNVLTSTNRRVRIVEGGHLADILPEVPSDLDNRQPDTFIASRVRAGWTMAGVGRIRRVLADGGDLTFIGNRGHRTFGRNDLVEATKPVTYTIESNEAGQRTRQGLYASREMADLNAGLINSASPAADAQVVPAR